MSSSQIAEPARPSALVSPEMSHTPNRESVPPHAWLWHGRIPSLDGLRAVSIIAVIAHHVAESYPNLFPSSIWCLAFEGHIGVDMFFVISGFLITLLLLREIKRNGSISLRGFYLRRFFRIVPAYVVYCAGVFALGHFYGGQPRATVWGAALTFMTDFDLHRQPWPWALVHTWTLSIEEHFYLLWPLLLWLKPRWGAPVALGCIASTPLIRFAICRFPIHSGNINVDFFTFTRWDTIAMGCLLAFAMTTWPLGRFRMIVKKQSLVLPVLLLGAIAISTFVAPNAPNRWWIWYSNTLRNSVIGAALTGILWLTLESPDSALVRLLNTRPFVIVGWLSYSLYLWQEVFTEAGQHAWFVRFPINFLGMAIMAVCSYLLVERPFVGFRGRLERKSMGDAPTESTAIVA